MVENASNYSKDCLYDFYMGAALAITIPAGSLSRLGAKRVFHPSRVLKWNRAIIMGGGAHQTADEPSSLRLVKDVKSNYAPTKMPGQGRGLRIQKRHEYDHNFKKLTTLVSRSITSQYYSSCISIYYQIMYFLTLDTMSSNTAQAFLIVTMNHRLLQKYCNSNQKTFGPQVWQEVWKCKTSQFDKMW